MWHHAQLLAWVLGLELRSLGFVVPYCILSRLSPVSCSRFDNERDLRFRDVYSERGFRIICLQGAWLIDSVYREVCPPGQMD